MAVTAAATVTSALAGSASLWPWSQDDPVPGWLWWLCAAAAAALPAAWLPVRRRAPERERGTGTRAVGFLLLALLTVFLAAQVAGTVRERLGHPRRTTAWVTGCRVSGQEPGGDGGGLGAKTYACTFRWSVDGREFSAERPQGPYPRGHEITVWLDERGRMSTGRPSWLSVPLFALPLPFTVYGAVFLGRWTAEDLRERWHRGGGGGGPPPPRGRGGGGGQRGAPPGLAAKHKSRP
ncbi:hypothetical protein ACFWXO_23975, partial [Kitasatospora sp. NPDC059088]|uniref:hypothetical protein n=1 Tax=Kitasatospora sp. NPDC059088 TaxID=3346722 RepID=UPI0036B48CDC